MANLIEKTPVPLIFKKIFQENLYGELIITADDHLKSLFFSKGLLVFASSNLPEERLGDLLFNKGKITREQFVMLQKMREQSEDKFGKLLVKHRVLSKQELYVALQLQVKAIAAASFSLTSGEWTFKTDAPKIGTNLKFSIPLYEVIIDGCQTITDFSYYKHRFYYRAPVYIPIPEWLGQILSPEHIRLYFKFSQCESISTEQIFSVMGLPEIDFWRHLTLFYLLNLLDFTDFRVDRQFNQNLELLNDLHRRLKADAIDHYQLLELRNTESVSEAKDKYFSFTRKYDPESLNAPPDSQAAQKAAFVVEKATQAYETLTSEEKKKAYDTGYHTGMDAEATAPGKEDMDRKLHGQKARTLYLKAHSLYEEKKFHEAVRFLEEAVQLDPEHASYFMLLGLCQMRIPEYRPYAEKNLLRVAKLEPWNADPVFYLGQLYWAEHLYKKAEKCYRKALQINMEHTMAARMVSEIEEKFKKKSMFSLFGKK